MKKLLLTIACWLIILATANPAMAQQYDRSAGVRLGWTTGFTYKKFIVDEQAIELMLSSKKGIRLTGIYQIHLPLNMAFNENFFVNFGVGGHVGYEERNDINKEILDGSFSNFQYREQHYFAIGIDGIAGLEYRMLTIPITLSIDVKPELNYVGFKKLDSRFWDVAIAVKYVF